MSTAKHFLEETVRNQVHLIAEPSLRSAFVIEKIISAAEGYAQELISREIAPSLFEAIPLADRPIPTARVRLQNGTIVNWIHDIRKPLLDIIPKERTPQ